jgi:glycosyltransferase involved in cell wall biosynthesis
MSGRDIDIVIERETAFGAGAVLSSLLGVPMVLEMVGPRVSPVSLKRANRVLAYSTLMVGGRVPRGKLDIVPAGVDTEAFRPDPSERASVRRRLGLDDDFLVGYVGTFQVWHGVEALLSAAAKLAEDGIKVKILLVGPYFASAQKFAAGLGLASDSIFVGPVSYELVPAYVNACDVLCAPYDPSLSKMRTEGGIGAPLKVLEYMACEKPVVTTLVRPITDVVRDGVNGMLVPPGDVQALAEAIKDLYLTPDRARGMGREGRRTVVEGYSWGSLARMLDRVLASARDNYLGNEATSN